MSGPEATLHRLIEQLETFYQDRFEEPSAINDWDELVRQANILTSRIETLAVENAEMAQEHDELRQRCEQAEQAQATLRCATERLSEKVTRLEEEREALGRVETSLGERLVGVRRDNAEVLGRSQEIQTGLEEAVELAEQWQLDKVELESHYSEVVEEIKTLVDGVGEAPDQALSDDSMGAGLSELPSVESQNDDNTVNVAPQKMDDLQGTAERLSSEVASLTEENQVLRKTIDSACERMQALVHACPAPASGRDDHGDL